MKNTTHKTKSNVTIEIYVGTYHKYNCGSLNGAWVDLTQFANYDEFMEFCKKLHSDEPDAEYMFQDSTCDFVFADMIGEHGVDEDVFEAIELYGDLDTNTQEIVAALMDASGLGFFDAVGKYEDLFVTDDIDTYCVDYVVDMGLPEFALNYFDYAKFQRDLEMDLITGSCNGKDFYFYNY